MNNNIKSFLIKHLIATIYVLGGVLNTIFGYAFGCIFDNFKNYKQYIIAIICILLLLILLFLNDKYLAFKLSIPNNKKYIYFLMISSYWVFPIFIYISFSSYFDIIYFGNKYIIVPLFLILGTISFIVGEYIINKYVYFKETKTILVM